MPAAAPLPAAFYRRPTVDVARSLIGCLLLRRIGRQLVGGRILETEAYLPNRDAACHAARGLTPGNASMFGPAGRSYVYSIHAKWCFNVVTERRGVGAAVLIRAIEPLFGMGVMSALRSVDDTARLAAGPARLCQALDIDRRADGCDLTCGRRLWIAADESPRVERIPVKRTHRIGVTSARALRLRFVWRGHPLASGPKSLR